MSPPRPPIEDRLDQAVEWMLRLEAPHADEAEWLAFDAWASASPENAAAFDRALATAAEVRHAAATLRASSAAVIPFPARRSEPTTRPARHLMVGSIAASILAVAVVVAPVWRSLQPAVYETSAGQRRTITLKDGSKVDLNGASKLSVKFSRGQRLASLDGEAVFDVAHDTKRPFFIEAGDRRVRVVGTMFDVRRREGRMSVTVARGIVEVAPGLNAVGQTLRLTAGHRLDHLEGSGDGQVSAVVADEALGWRTGHLIYRDAPMSEVVADLNAQFARPMTLSDGAGAVRFSGVLVVDDQAAVVQRLSMLAPVSSTVTKNEIILRGEASAR
jgi:transmembrane sensor